MSPDSDMRTEVGAPESAVPLPQLFRSVASRWPDLIAIHVADGDWTFRKLDETSDRIAAALQRDAVRVGNRVGLYCPNGAEFAAIYLGILKAGATVVPVNLLLNPKEVAFILDDAGVGILFYHSSLAEAVGAVRKALRGPLRGIAVAGGAGSGVNECLAGVSAQLHRYLVLRRRSQFVGPIAKRRRCRPNASAY